MRKEPGTHERTARGRRRITVELTAHSEEAFEKLTASRREGTSEAVNRAIILAERLDRFEAQEAELFVRTTTKGPLAPLIII